MAAEAVPQCPHTAHRNCRLDGNTSAAMPPRYRCQQTDCQGQLSYCSSQQLDIFLTMSISQGDISISGHLQNNSTLIGVVQIELIDRHFD